MDQRGHHRLDHIPGFRCPRGDRCLLDRWNSDTHASRKNIGIAGAALVFINQHKTARVAQPLDPGNSIHTFECGQHHAVHKSQLVLGKGLAVRVHFIDKEFAGFHAFGFRVGDSVDVTLAQFGFHHAFGVAHTAKPQMADIGLAGHKGDGYTVANIGAA